MDTASIMDTASPIFMTILIIMEAIVMTTIMITMTIAAQTRARVAQIDLKVPRVPTVLVHGDNRSAVLDDLIYMYVAKRIMFVDSQLGETILSLCLYSHFLYMLTKCIIYNSFLSWCYDVGSDCSE